MASIYRRGKTWWVQYYVDCELQRKSLRTRDEGKAEKMRAAIELQLEKGEIQKKERTLTLDSFLTEYEKAYVHAGGKTFIESRRRSWKSDLAALKVVIDFFKRRRVRRVGSVERKHVVAFREWRLSTPATKGPAKGRIVSNATVNKSLRCGKAAWSWAVEKGYARENPFKGLKSVQEPAYDPETLGELQIRRVLEEGRSEPIVPLMATAAYTGLRNAEVRHLEWTDVDLEELFIRISCSETFHTKSRKPREVPIPEELAAILRPLYRPVGLCFPSPRTGGRGATPAYATP
ncbi:tyrosine-type recombinase/integrase [Planctomycetota bacterium]